MLNTNIYYRRPRREGLKRTAKLCEDIESLWTPSTAQYGLPYNHSLQDLCVGGGGGGRKNVCRRKLTGLIYLWLINGPLIISSASQAQTISPNNGLQRTHSLPQNITPTIKRRNYLHPPTLDTTNQYRSHLERPINLFIKYNPH